MISFGDLKNNISQLKKYLNKMGLFRSDDYTITAKQFDEDNLRRKKNQLFLPLVNYLLLQYPKELCIKVIQKQPTIRALKDKEFIEKVMVISRQILTMQVSLTPAQFLSESFFEKKVQFLSQLAKRVYEWEDSRAKMKGKFEQEQKKQKEEEYNFECYDDEEEEEVRVINIKPKEFIQKNQMEEKKNLNKPVSKMNKLAEYLDEDSYIEEKPKNIKKTAPKGRWNHWQDEENEEQERQVKKQNILYQPKQRTENQKQKEMFDKYMVKDKEPIPKYHQKPQETYVTKEEFEEMITLVKTLTQSINYTSKVFQNFQNKVENQYGKMNARLTFVETTVKMLKDNL